MIKKNWLAGFCLVVIAYMVVLIGGCDKDKSKGNEEDKALSKKEVKERVVQAKEAKVESVKVKLETSMGDIVIELDKEKAPVSVENFLTYIEEDFYGGVIFHRVMNNFMIQGGGFISNMSKKETHPPIVNEAKNGLKNNRGTIAMARTNDPDSATSQFFINHKDNDFLNYTGASNPGYAVFGKVIEGMDVVDKIAVVKTGRIGPYGDVPLEPVVIKSAKVISEQ
ncbi:MAG: peptidylprolyl isomerase [Planctomycetota bacterium]|jgi:cyclophilin family peptidyl-prolyl cis-trans isomerase